MRSLAKFSGLLLMASLFCRLDIGAAEAPPVKAVPKQGLPLRNARPANTKSFAVKSPPADAAVTPGPEVKSDSSWEVDAAVGALAFSADGRRLASGSGDGIIRVWDVATGQVLRQCTGHGGRITCVAFSFDGKSLLSGSLDKTMRLWNTETGAELRQFAMPIDNTRKGQQFYGVFGVAFTPDGRFALSASSQGGPKIPSLILWDLKSGNVVRSFERIVKSYPSPAGPISVTPELGGELSLSAGGRAVLASATGSLLLFDVGSGRLANRSKDLGEPLFSPQGFSAGFREISLLDIALSPGDQYAAAGCADKTLRIWDAHTMIEAGRFPGHADKVNRIAFAPDGRSIAAAARADVLRIWNLENGAEQFRLLGHTQALEAVAFAPDGRTVAAGGADKKIYLWTLPK